MESSDNLQKSSLDKGEDATQANTKDYIKQLLIPKQYRYTIHPKMTFIWIPAHTRINGNEKADLLVCTYNEASIKIENTFWIRDLQKLSEERYQVVSIYIKALYIKIKKKHCIS